MAFPKTSQDLASYFDHTILKPDARQSDVEKVCIESIEYNFFGVCVNSSYIPFVVKKLAGSKVVPLAVVGFPLGASHPDAKAYETKQAIGEGSREIDTVVNLGAYFSGQESAVRHDLAAVIEAAGTVPVKVILETAYLTPAQIKELTTWSVLEGAAYVKTSTGFASRGASVADIQVMRQMLLDLKKEKTVGIKASGGVRDYAFMKQLIEAGATRVGASASVAILKEFSQSS
jgi:deoxyribose-phosphate aldolase